jgi:hypothetical protein
MAAERRLLSALLLPGMQAMLRARRVTFDWIDLNRGGVDQAATAANAAVGAAVTANAAIPWGWLGRGLRMLDRRCGIPLSSAVWVCNYGGHSRATVPFVLTLLGENLGPQAPPGSMPQRLLESWEAWSKNQEIGNGNGAASGFTYVSGVDINDGGGGDAFGEASGHPVQVITVGFGDGGSLGGLADDRSRDNRGGDPPGALELETVRAWLRQPAAACEGLVWPVSLSLCASSLPPKSLYTSIPLRLLPFPSYPFQQSPPSICFHHHCFAMSPQSAGIPSSPPP